MLRPLARRLNTIDLTLDWPEDRWTALIQPTHGRAENPRYLQLLAALDQGWEISTPVYRRPRWLDEEESVYHFILKHPRYSGLRLVTVPDDAQVRDFLSNQRLAVH